jgi:hypothetical protein
MVRWPLNGELVDLAELSDVLGIWVCTMKKFRVGPCPLVVNCTVARVVKASLSADGIPSKPWRR